MYSMQWYYVSSSFILPLNFVQDSHYKPISHPNQENSMSTFLIHLNSTLVLSLGLGSDSFLLFFVHNDLTAS